MEMSGILLLHNHCFPVGFHCEAHSITNNFSVTLFVIFFSLIVVRIVPNFILIIIVIVKLRTFRIFNFFLSFFNIIRNCFPIFFFFVLFYLNHLYTWRGFIVFNFLLLCFLLANPVMKIKQEKLLLHSISELRF